MTILEAASQRHAAAGAEPIADELAALRSIEQRVLWLSTAMIHHANSVRPNPDRTKVGGHQASAASSVSLLTALYFKYLRAGDRIAVKPHASPAFHAIQYLLGNLDRDYLTRLREFHGLQSYPSRTKDPDDVHFSTGSMGLGVVAPLFAALAERYLAEHFGPRPARRFVSISGDAELDEGSVWEAAADEAVRGVGNALFIIDLNRQSLDRVVPGVRAAGLEAMFRGSGWHVLEAKYGRRLQAAFARPGGESLRRRIDEMANEEYQLLIRRPGATVRERLVQGAHGYGDELRRSLIDVSDEELPGLLADLGGHDLAELLSIFDAADTVDQPTVLFAYTIKGWGLPFAGDPLNHSMLLTDSQYETFREKQGIAIGSEWDSFPFDSAEGQLIQAAADRLREDRTPKPIALVPDDVPTELGITPPATTSTQEAFGNLMAQLARVPKVGPRIVTSSADVAVSTNLGSWVNRTGVFALKEQTRYEADVQRILKWEPGPGGQHIELGISEINLFLLLGQFGLTQELLGELLLPVGTLYDPFVCRGLDPLFYSVYAGAKFVFAATPSGITLSPEGGAHQSLFTPSIGMEMPHLVLFEPAFARELEWVLLEALRACCDREGGYASYLRLVTKPDDQSLLEPALRRLGEAELRRQVLAGGYRSLEAAGDGGLKGAPVVQIAAVGAMVPEAVAATIALWDEGVAANLINLTCADRIYSQLRGVRRRAVQEGVVSREVGYLGELIPPDERRAPIVSVLDGASHTLSFLGTAFGAPQVSLGVDDFGQSGTRADLYRENSIDTESIVNAALLALDLAR